MARYWRGSDLIPPEEVAAGSVTNQMAQRWLQLQQLQVLAGAAGGGVRTHCCATTQQLAAASFPAQHGCVLIN